MDRKKPRFTVNLGGEGEVSGAVNINHECICEQGWSMSRDGRIGLKEVKKSGPVVVAESSRLPIADKSVLVVYHNVPIDRDSLLGEGYPSFEIERIRRT